MPKDFFCVANTTSLSDIPRGSKIHVIGVCGVAMAQLAVALTERGYDVSGSDKEFYEPMKTVLSRSKVKTQTGYQANNVPLDAALVVIGNAVSYGHPEVEVVESNKLPYTCFPKLLQEVLIADKHSIVVTGTHGKSTTTAIVATILLKADRNPAYFVGGVVRGLPESLALGSGNVSVVEGDEYDSAFFAKVPKFSFYKARTAIVNAIEYDHADIYSDVESIEREFSALVTGLPADGLAICCIDFPRVKRLVNEWRKNSPVRIQTFGTDPDADVRITSRITEGYAQRITLEGAVFGKLMFAMPMIGEYNARNAVAALLASMNAGVAVPQIVASLATFERVKRRQELRCVKDGVALIEDFAHHPTAVAQTVQAMREAYPTAKLWAIFEPRSNTSRRKIFQQDYIDAFSKTDVAILKHVTARAIDQGHELLDVSELSDQIAATGNQSYCMPDVEAIRAHLWNNIVREKGSSDIQNVVVVMSNGSFDGLNEMLEQDLNETVR